MSKFSFIIQGPTSRAIKSPFKKNFLNFFKELKNNGEVILSTYKNEPIDEFSSFCDHIIQTTQFHRHKHPPQNYKNIYNQFESCLNGSLIANNEFCIKFRTDEFYSNLDFILSKVKNKKLMCSNIHFISPEYNRIHNYTEKFRASDHFFGTNKNTFIAMCLEALDAIGYRDFRLKKFEQYIKDNNLDSDKEKYDHLYEMNILQSPEGILLKAFVNSQNISLKDKTYFDVINNYLSIVDINKCSPYIWGMGGGHLTNKDSISMLLSDNSTATLNPDNDFSKEWVTEEFINENLHTR